MSIIDAYLRYRKDNGKSKTRFNLEVYAGECSVLLNSIGKRDGKIFVYYGTTPKKTRKKQKEGLKSDMGMNVRDGWLTSLFYVGGIESRYRFGDIKDTNDAFVFNISEDAQTLEVFFCKGKKDSYKYLFDLILDGELDSEIQEIKNKAFAGTMKKSLK